MWWISVVTPGGPERQPRSWRRLGQWCGLIAWVAGFGSVATLAAEGVAEPTTYRWKDRQGVQHTSNLPPQAYTRDGRLKPAYHPYRAEAQHPAMVQALRAREAELQAAKEAAEAEQSAAAEVAQRQSAESEAGNAAFSRLIPKRRMSIGELLQLDKNAGRPLE